jgi:hypothetical protein
VIGLALFALIGIGIRLLIMFTIQQRRERMNRQINERLRTLIAAYKVLGGSFTGKLTVDPTHLRDLRRPPSDPVAESDATADLDPTADSAGGSDRARRIRDSVEAALSDIILLGTEEHVRLAERAARELTAGRPVHTHELVVSLRNFIREALRSISIRSRPTLQFRCRAPRDHRVPADAAGVSVETKAPGKAPAEEAEVDRVPGWGWVLASALVSD